MLPVRWLKWLRLTRIDGRPERQAAASAPSWAWAAAGSAPSAAARSPARKIFNFISQLPKVGPCRPRAPERRGQDRRLSPMAAQIVSACGEIVAKDGPRLEIRAS